MGLDCLKQTPGWLIDELNKIISREENFEKFAARRRQRQHAAALGQNRKSAEGLGRVRMEVDPVVYHYWGRKLGYTCWKDKTFLREMERDNPELRVKCAGTKLQVGYGSLSSRAQRKFSKVYA